MIEVSLRDKVTKTENSAKVTTFSFDRPAYPVLMSLGAEFIGKLMPWAQDYDPGGRPLLDEVEKLIYEDPPANCFVATGTRSGRYVVIGIKHLLDVHIQSEQVMDHEPIVDEMFQKMKDVYRDVEGF